MVDRFIAWLKELAASLESQTAPAPRGRVSNPSLTPPALGQLRPGRAKPIATMGLCIKKGGRWYTEEEARAAGIMVDIPTTVTVEILH